MEYRAKASDFGAWLDRNVGKVGYLIGTRGQICTQSMIDYRLSSTSYIKYWTNIKLYAPQWLGKPVADCYGVYEMFLSGGEWDKPLTYWKYADITTGVAYNTAKQANLPNGLIATLPKNIPYPIAVGYDGHVGFFYKGVVYQSSGHRYGLEKTELTSTAHNSAWKYWYYLPWLDYTETATSGGGEQEMIVPSNVASQVVYDLQTAYKKLGYNIGAFKNMFNSTILDGRDGKYGDICVGITKQIQTKHGIPQTGNVDEVTFSKIMIDLTTLPSGGISQAELDAEKARTAQALADLAIANSKATTLQTDLTNLNGLLNKAREAVKTLNSL